MRQKDEVSVSVNKYALSYVVVQRKEILLRPN